jgi:adenylate cyclase
MDKARHAAVLFADVAGSTSLYELMGDAKALARIGGCLARLRDVVTAAGGRVIKSIGDELMCAFPDAPTALRAASDMQLLQTKTEAALSLRIGFHAGETIERDGDLFGDTVNLAARVVEYARPRQILTTEPTALALPDFMRMGTRKLGSLNVRGRQQPVDLYEIVWQWSSELTMVDANYSALSTDAPERQLSLVYRGRTYEFPRGTTQMTIGRGEDNDIVVPVRQASRLHGRIELRQAVFVLVDVSTNGTFVRMDGGDELVLRREALPLHGAGVISLGHSTSASAPADLVEFSCI